MKKKFVAMIALSSVGLLLGGLIYLGISSFPELLESEKSVKNEESGAIVPVVKDTIIVEEEKLFEEPASANVSSTGYSEYIPSSFDFSEIEYIDIPKISHNKIVSFESEKISRNDDSLVGFVEDFIVAEPVSISSESVAINPIVSVNHSSSSYSSKEEKTETIINKVNKTKVNNKQTVRSNQALVETSLLVVGAVDLLSIILVKRKKHLFR